MNGDDKPKCGTCKWAKESDAADAVECHGEPPALIMVPTQQGIVLQAFYPKQPAEEGWCRLWEYGQPVKLSKIVVPKLKLSNN